MRSAGDRLLGVFSGFGAGVVDVELAVQLDAAARGFPVVRSTPVFRRPLVRRYESRRVRRFSMMTGAPCRTHDTHPVAARSAPRGGGDGLSSEWRLSASKTTMAITMAIPATTGGALRMVIALAARRMVEALEVMSNLRCLTPQSFQGRDGFLAGRRTPGSAGGL